MSDWATEKARELVAQHEGKTLVELVAAGVRAGADAAAAVELQNRQIKAMVVALAEKLAQACTDAVTIAKK